MGTTLTGYGGVGEIGGNAFLLDDGRSRIFLDFGRRFGNDPQPHEDPRKDTSHMRPGWGDYFDSFLQPRRDVMARDLVSLQIIPDVMASYRLDIGGAEGKPDIDAVVVSHAHADHAGLLGLLKPDVPILLSDESKATLASLQETGASGVESELVQYKAKGYGRRADGAFSTAPKRPAVDRPMSDATKTDVGDWDVEQFAVDHSIHGARGTLLSGRDISVAYTGDFRLHGRDGDATKRFLERAAGADILITEGTNVHQGHKHEGTDDEASVEGEIEDHVQAAGGGFVAISFPPRDLDRFLSVYHVAKRLGRRLAMTTKQAHLIESLRKAGRTDLPDPRTDSVLAIYLRHKGRGTMSGPEGQLRLFRDDGEVETLDVSADEWSKVVTKEYAPWERGYLECDNVVTAAEIRQAPEEWMLSISYWSITDLLDIFPDERPGGVYIHSMTQPFNDEMLISDRKLRRWLDAFNLTRRDTHVSGHLSEDDLHWAIDEIGAKKLVPIHSMHPELTAERYKARTGQDAWMPHWGKPLRLA